MNRRSLALLVMLSGCGILPPAPTALDEPIQREITKATEGKAPPTPQLEQALLPPLRMEMPQAAGAPIDSRFDLSVSNAPAPQVFNSLVTGTRYSMLVHPNVTGIISVNLKDVTLREALESIRDLYGYEYRIDGTRILVQPAGIQTRVFQVNYLAGQRRSLSQVRVASNSQVEVGPNSTANSTAGGTAASSSTSTGTGAGTLGGTLPGGVTIRESTRITTNHEATFWSDLCEALVALTFPDAGAGPGAAAAGAQQQPEDRQRSLCNRRHAQSDRSIVVSPHSGVVVVRATAAELRSVENYLRATRIAVERQVMLEAKIIEVTLSEQYQAGINWMAFSSNSRFAVGQITTAAFPGGRPPPAAEALAGAQTPVGAIFGLAANTPNFAALIAFLESQGNVQVLSSPRVATLNNQKAVLRVGDEQLFVSNITSSREGATVVGGTNTTVITPTFSPYFDGIVLDVTPQIDENGMITLHVHPSINSVIPSTIKVPVGASDPVDVPTALSRVRETDTIVRVSDGNIVAIGGLMRTEVSDLRSGVPGVPDSGIGLLFRSAARKTEKKELVILLKPTIVDSAQAAQDVRDTRGRIEALGRQMERR